MVDEELSSTAVQDLLKVVPSGRKQMWNMWEESMSIKTATRRHHIKDL